MAHEEEQTPMQQLGSLLVGDSRRRIGLIQDFLITDFTRFDGSDQIQIWTQDNAHLIVVNGVRYDNGFGRFIVAYRDLKLTVRGLDNLLRIHRNDLEDFQHDYQRLVQWAWQISQDAIAFLHDLRDKSPNLETVGQLVHITEALHGLLTSWWQLCKPVQANAAILEQRSVSDFFAVLRQVEKNLEKVLRVPFGTYEGTYRARFRILEEEIADPLLSAFEDIFLALSEGIELTGDAE